MGAVCDFDCVVIGAGAAGIGAAWTLTDAGYDVLVLEALPRIGGRAYSETIAGFQFDWGCHWLHSASVNPLRLKAEQLGVEYSQASLKRQIKRGDAWLDAEAMALRARFHAECERRIAAYQGPSDRSIRELLEADSELFPWYEFWTTLTCSLNSDVISAADYTRYHDTEENWPVLGGYGRLIAKLAAPLNIRTGTCVQQIERTAKKSIVKGDFGTISAQTVIITASTNALATGALEFSPALPVEIEESFHHVVLGHANKYLFPIIGDERDLPESAYLCDEAYLPDACSVHCRPYGRPWVAAHTGGRFARDLELLPRRDALAAVKEQLISVLGAGVGRLLGQGQASAWGTIPSIAGAYSSAIPGFARSRVALSEPFDERVGLAGEACSIDHYSTAHGAYESGMRTAKHLLERTLDNRR